MKRTFALLLLMAVASLLSAQKESRAVNKGNTLYKKEKYTEAEQHYRQGIEANRQSYAAVFNLGDALYRQEKYPEALEQFKQAAVLAGDNKKRVAASCHNAGNALLQSGQIEQSIAAYKEALRNNPEDDESRYNLAAAQRLLKQQQQNQNQNQNQQQQQEEQKQEDKKQQEQQQQDQQEQQEQQQQQQNPEQISKEQAQQILEALQQDEKEVQQKVKEKQKKAKRYNVEKEW
ncbi:MAG: tetratricopeptide repeat protein [Prevotellaceae bacterium]|jgi:tetratricopeptide (TPR) repeat protein|nr:tetratricopeptide repeat protein [Prevotellaceae bacterium]